MLAKYKIKSVAIPPRKISSYITTSDSKTQKSSLLKPDTRIASSEKPLKKRCIPTI